MELDYTEKVVVVTGGSEGIGFAAARKFGGLGAKVAICARNPERLQQAAEALEQDGIEVFASPCDASDARMLFGFADSVEARFGQIDVWISNAGYMPRAFLKDMTEDFWDKVIDVNLKSVYLGGRIAYDKMRERGGVLLHASSFASVIPSVGYSAYAAAKAGVSSLTRTFASELAPYGIRVLGYIPGFIDTPLNKETKARSLEKAVEPISLRRLGEASDVADALVFLASDLAAYMTGTCVEISGGKFATQNPSAAWE